MSEQQKLIQPVLSQQALLDDVRAADAADQFHLWWLGQSGFLLKWQNRHLLFDPYLSDSLTSKYAETDKPHVRMTELAVHPRRLDFIDLVTSSHNHTDHLDCETLSALLSVNRGLRLLVPAANRSFAAERLSVPPDRLDVINAGQTVDLAGFQIHGVPAAHELLELDEQGQHRFMGYVVQFGDWTVYHSGDTILYDGMVEILRRWKIDVALLPINGSLPERRVSGNLWGRQAVQLAQQVGIRLVIPCHFEMFTFNTVSTDELVESAGQVGQNYCVLRCGERWSSSQLPGLA